MRGHDRVARYAAPAAFLLAVTVAVLLVRSGLENGDQAAPPPTVTTAAATTEAPPATTETAPTTPTETAEPEYYEIQSGDTLAVVAERYGTTVEQLLVLNPDVDPVALTVGERIRVK
jgi:LysM repeat protein